MEDRMSDKVRGIHPLLRLTVIAGVVTALALGGLGVFLTTRTGPDGTPSDISILGSTIKSSNAGVIAIFLAVVLLILVVRRAMSSADVALKSGSIKVGEELQLKNVQAGDVSGVRSKASGPRAGDIEVLKKAKITGGKIGDISGVTQEGEGGQPGVKQ